YWSGKMPTWIIIILAILIIQRLAELLIAKRNEQRLKAHGAIEVGEQHYKWFIIVHIAFFIGIILEMTLVGHIATEINADLLTISLATQLMRVWCITSLGTYWNTRIIILPNSTLIKKRPYKYVSHPNYIIVGFELCIIPLLFGAYVTALVFPLIHILLSTVRIPLENEALKGTSSANATFKHGGMQIKKR